MSIHEEDVTIICIDASNRTETKHVKHTHAKLKEEIDSSTKAARNLYSTFNNGPTRDSYNNLKTTTNKGNNKPW